MRISGTFKTDTLFAKLDGTDRQYLKEHPELIEYWDMKKHFEGLFDAATVRAGKYLRQPTYPDLRTDVGDSLGQQKLLEYLQQPQNEVYSYTWDDWRGYMSKPLERLVLDYAMSDKKLSTAARDQIEYMAGQMGIDASLMLELMRQSAIEQP